MRALYQQACGLIHFSLNSKPSFYPSSVVSAARTKGPPMANHAKQRQCVSELTWQLFYCNFSTDSLSAFSHRSSDAPHFWRVTVRAGALRGRRARNLGELPGRRGDPPRVLQCAHLVFSSSPAFLTRLFSRTRSREGRRSHGLLQAELEEGREQRGVKWRAHASRSADNKINGTARE